ncbi:MAG TPA: metalloregulator ArsR/SmtB family transcription factor [Chloroflexia bacterium]|nr:metalloregulator ArsR/SmtB family transcription factor [Chloroflexia bacterium]
MKTVIELQERKRGDRCCEPAAAPSLNDEAAQQLSDDLALLAHPIRIRILDLLARQEGQVCVCDLDGALPVKQPTVSHHLRLLREAGLIDCEKHGLWAYYFVKRDALAALRARVSDGLAAIS